MSDAALRAVLLDILAGIAPEADLAAVKDDDDLRETLDLDSMDFLNFVIAVHERTGRPIPEADQSNLATLGGTVAYLRR